MKTEKQRYSEMSPERKKARILFANEYQKRVRADYYRSLGEEEYAKHLARVNLRKLKKPEPFINRDSPYHKYYESYARSARKRILKRFGLTLEDWTTLLEKQRYECAICLKPFNLNNPRAIHLDHNHQSRKVRAILCCNCNLLLGYSKENMETLKQAIKYLERYNG